MSTLLPAVAPRSASHPIREVMVVAQAEEARVVAVTDHFESLKQIKNSIFAGSNLLSDYQLKTFSKQIREVIIFNSKNKQRTLVYD